MPTSSHQNVIPASPCAATPVPASPFQRGRFSGFLLFEGLTPPYVAGFMVFSLTRNDSILRLLKCHVPHHSVAFAYAIARAEFAVKSTTLLP